MNEGYTLKFKVQKVFFRYLKMLFVVNLLKNKLIFKIHIKTAKRSLKYFIFADQPKIKHQLKYSYHERTHVYTIYIMYTQCIYKHCIAFSCCLLLCA